MQSTLEIMIGKLSATQFLFVNPYLGPIIVSGYCSIIIFFALNIFISIVIESFDKVRAEAKINPDKFGFMGHILGKFKNLFRKKQELAAHTLYKSHLNILPNQVDNIINHLIKVITLFTNLDLIKIKFNKFK